MVILVESSVTGDGGVGSVKVTLTPVTSALVIVTVEGLLPDGFESFCNPVPRVSISANTVKLPFPFWPVPAGRRPLTVYEPEPLVRAILVPATALQPVHPLGRTRMNTRPVFAPA